MTAQTRNHDLIGPSVRLAPRRSSAPAERRQSMSAQGDPGFWDKVAAKYSRQPVKDPAAYEHTLTRTASFLTPQDRVLEIGCGTGSTALKLSGKVAHYTGSDISGEMIGIARGKAAESSVSNVDFIQAAVTELDAANGPYDAVLAFSLLHLVEDLPAALAHTASLLKPGGLLISKTVCLGHGAALWRPVIAVMRFFGKAPFVGMIKPVELEAMIGEAGFEILESEDHGTPRPPKRFIVARKL